MITLTLTKCVNNVLPLVKHALEQLQLVLLAMEVRYCTSQLVSQNVLNHLIFKITSVLIVILLAKHVLDLQNNVSFVLKICIFMSKNASCVLMGTKEMTNQVNVNRKIL